MQACATLLDLKGNWQEISQDLRPMMDLEGEGHGEGDCGLFIGSAAMGRGLSKLLQYGRGSHLRQLAFSCPACPTVENGPRQRNQMWRLPGLEPTRASQGAVPDRQGRSFPF